MKKHLLWVAWVGVGRWVCDDEAASGGFLQAKIPPGIVGVSEVAGEEGKERVRVVLWFGQTRSNPGVLDWA